MNYTQRGGLKNLLKLKKNDIAKLFIAELNRSKSTFQANSTFQATSSREIINIENKTGEDIINHDSLNLFDTFEKLPSAANNSHDSSSTITDKTVISVSPTMVAHKSDVHRSEINYSTAFNGNVKNAIYNKIDKSDTGKKNYPPVQQALPNDLVERSVRSGGIQKNI